MNRFTQLAALLLLGTGLATAQVSNPSIVIVATAPSGACSGDLPLQTPAATGDLYSCQSGTWGQISGGGTAVSLMGTGPLASIDLRGMIPQLCSDTSGSGTAKTCTTNNVVVPLTNTCLTIVSDTANSGTSMTLNVNSLGATSVAVPSASGWTTTLIAGQFAANTPYIGCYNGTNWNIQSLGVSGGASGAATTTQGTATVYPALYLPKWRLALAKVKVGFSDAKVIFIGDSTIAGSVAQALANTMPSRLVNRFNSSSPVTAIQEFSNDYVQDYKVGTWALGTGCSASATGAGVSCTVGSTATTWTPGGTQPCDSFRLEYMTNGGLGTITVSATGGTPSVINTNTTAGNHWVTVTAASLLTTNALSFQNTGGSGTIYVGSVECYDSTTTHVRFANYGKDGTKTSDWLSGANPFGIYDGFTTYQPDLTIIGLGINDAGASVPCSTTISNLQTIITAAQVSGDVILMTVIPSSGSPYDTNEASCYPSYSALAATNNIPLVDMYARFGQTWNTNLMFNALHPNSYGYADWAGAIYQVLNAAQ